MDGKQTSDIETLTHRLHAAGLAFLAPSSRRGALAASCGVVPSEDNLARLQAAWCVDRLQPAQSALTG